MPRVSLVIGSSLLFHMHEHCSVCFISNISSTGEHVGLFSLVLACEEPANDQTRSTFGFRKIMVSIYSSQFYTVNFAVYVKTRWFLRKARQRATILSIVSSSLRFKLWLNLNKTAKLLWQTNVYRKYFCSCRSCKTILAKCLVATCYRQYVGISLKIPSVWFKCNASVET